jgi:hypothetical protein
MPQAPTVARLVAIMLAELERQAANDGPFVEHEGTRAQVDGSFDLAPIAVAVLQEFAR